MKHFLSNVLLSPELLFSPKSKNNLTISRAASLITTKSFQDLNPDVSAPGIGKRPWGTQVSLSQPPPRRPFCLDGARAPCCVGHTSAHSPQRSGLRSLSRGYCHGSFSLGVHDTESPPRGATSVTFLTASPPEFEKTPPAAQKELSPPCSAVKKMGEMSILPKRHL